MKRAAFADATADRGARVGHGHDAAHTPSVMSASHLSTMNSSALIGGKATFSLSGRGRNQRHDDNENL
jgi:hypothetical protein